MANKLEFIYINDYRNSPQAHKKKKGKARQMKKIFKYKYTVVERKNTYTSIHTYSLRKKHASIKIQKTEKTYTQ